MEYGTSTPIETPAPSLPISTPPVLPPAAVIPPPVFVPQPVAPRTVFESTPDRTKRRRGSHPIRNGLLIVLLLFILIITILYFWGAYLAGIA